LDITQQGKTKGESLENLSFEITSSHPSHSVGHVWWTRGYVHGTCRHSGTDQLPPGVEVLASTTPNDNNHHNHYDHATTNNNYRAANDNDYNNCAADNHNNDGPNDNHNDYNTTTD